MPLFTASNAFGLRVFRLFPFASLSLIFRITLELAMQL